MLRVRHKLVALQFTQRILRPRTKMQFSTESTGNTTFNNVQMRLLKVVGTVGGIAAAALGGTWAFGTSLYFPWLRENIAIWTVQKKLENPKAIKPCKSFRWLEGEELGAVDYETGQFFLNEEGLFEFSLLWAPAGYGKTELAKKFLSDRSHAKGPNFYFALRKAGKVENNLWRLIGAQFGLDYDPSEMDSGCMLNAIEQALIEYTNKHKGKKPIMVFDDLDAVLMQKATEDAAASLCEWLVELHKNGLAAIKFVTSNQRLYYKMKSEIHGMHILSVAETPSRQREIEAHLKKHLKWKKISQKDISKLVVEVIGTNVGEAFSLIHQLDILKKKEKCRGANGFWFGPDCWVETFDRMREQFLYSRGIAIRAALRGDLGEGCTVPRGAIIQTAHAIFESLNETTSFDEWWCCHEVSYTEVFKRTSLTETVFIEAIEALHEAKVISCTNNRICTPSPGHISSYNQHACDETHMLLRAQAEREGSSKA